MASNALSHHVSCAPLDLQAFDSCVFTVVDEVWHQQAVLRLLQLIELPLLEDLLESKDTLQPPPQGRDSDTDLLYTSSYLDREILKAFSEAQLSLLKLLQIYSLPQKILLFSKSVFIGICQSS